MPEDPTKVDLKRLPAVEIGATGLNISGGYILEEWLLPTLSRTLWRKVVKEMRDNDAMVGAVLRVMELLTRQVSRYVEPGIDNNDGREKADFINGCLDDMSDTYTDTCAEIMTMLEWGFSAFEIVYKRRLGPTPGTYKDETGKEHGLPTSKYSDGLIGWRKWGPRAQETIETWDLDDGGGIRSFTQWAPPRYQNIVVPIEKALLFRPTSRKRNPEGVSILRTAWLSWFYKRELQRCEAIGIERELAGLPVLRVPGELFSSTDPGDASKLDDYKKLVRNLKRNEHDGVLLPSSMDPETKQYDYTLELLSTGGQRAIDPDKAIQRHDLAILTSMLADVLKVGHGATGSWALASSKTNLLATALGAYLDARDEVINRYAIPRLYAMNGWPQENLAQVKHGDVESVEWADIAEFVSKLSGAGVDMVLEPNFQQQILTKAGFTVSPEMLERAKQLDKNTMDRLSKRATALKSLTDAGASVESAATVAGFTPQEASLLGQIELPEGETKPPAGDTLPVQHDQES